MKTDSKFPDIFKPEDFKDSRGYLLSASECADSANKLLNESTTKYFCQYNPMYEVLGITKKEQEGDTHILYALEPQPIVREPFKKEYQDKYNCMSMSFTVPEELKGKRFKCTFEEITESGRE